MEKQFRKAERTAHLYALMAWNDSYSKEAAQGIAYTSEYEDLNGITWAETSIEAAVKGIKEKLLAGQKLPEEVNWSDIKLEDNDRVYDLIIEILEEIHNKWVVENAKKFNRGTEEKSNKNLFQHLPTALIGIDELSKDLMFLAPMLKEMGIDAGEMELVAYGSFKPSEKIKQAYARYVQKYKENFDIKSVKDLDWHITDCINGDYESLKPTSEVGHERLKYMKARVELLSNTVMKKNEIEFGALKDLTVDD